MSELAERRQSERAQFSMTGSFRPALAQMALPLLGQTVDISKGGLKVRLSTESELDFKAGDTIYLRISTMEPEGVLNVEGRVRWIKPSPDSEKEWELGIRLTEEELARWAVWLEEISALFALLLGLEE